MTASTDELVRQLLDAARTSQKLSSVGEGDDYYDILLKAARKITELTTKLDGVWPPRDSHYTITHDGFAGTVIGYYITHEGKRGVVLQQDGTKVVHVYSEKWLNKDPTR